MKNKLVPNVICLIFSKKQRQLGKTLFIWSMPTHFELSEELYHKLIQFVSLPAAFSCQDFFLEANYSVSNLILFLFGAMPASQNLLLQLKRNFLEDTQNSW